MRKSNKTAYYKKKQMCVALQYSTPVSIFACLTSAFSFYSGRTVHFTVLFPQSSPANPYWRKTFLIWFILTIWEGLPISFIKASFEESSSFKAVRAWLAMPVLDRVSVCIGERRCRSVLCMSGVHESSSVICLGLLKRKVCSRVLWRQVFTSTLSSGV